MIFRIRGYSKKSSVQSYGAKCPNAIFAHFQDRRNASHWGPENCRHLHKKNKKLHNWQPQDADLRVTNIGANLPSHAPTIAEAVANTTIRKYTRLAILQRESNVVWNSHSRNQAREPEENLRHGCEQIAITYYCMVHKQVK